MAWPDKTRILVFSSAGFSLIEAIITVGILSAAVIGAMSTLNVLNARNSADEQGIGLTLVRQQILNNLLGQPGWSNTIGSNLNPNFSCMKNLDSDIPSNRFCTDTPELLTFLDTSNTTLYDFKSATIGISPKGTICNAYVAPPGDPNETCPNHVAVSYTPLCSPSVLGCQNPPFLLEGTMERNGGAAGTISTRTLQFRTIRTTPSCPAATGTYGLLAGVNVTANAFSFVSTLAGPAPTVTRGEVDAIVMPCRRQTIQFYDKMQAAAAIVLPAAVTDPGNSQSLYIVSEDNSADLLEYRSSYVGGNYTYQLLENGVIVANKPSWVNLTDTTKLSFEVINGLAKFCVEGRCLTYFTEKIVSPFRYEVRPSSTAYSTQGIEIIGFDSRDL